MGKEKPFVPVCQIIGHSGIRDGAILKPNEPFTRSWTVLNAAPATSKEKGRVVKLMHVSGYELQNQLLFLWPVPGKLVTFSLDLIAPSSPGTYESFWMIEGTKEAEFWVKFRVELPETQSEQPMGGNIPFKTIPLPLSKRGSTPEVPRRKKRKRTKRSSSLKRKTKIDGENRQGLFSKNYGAQSPEIPSRAAPSITPRRRSGSLGETNNVANTKLKKEHQPLKISDIGNGVKENIRTPASFRELYQTETRDNISKGKRRPASISDGNLLSKYQTSSDTQLNMIPANNTDSTGKRININRKVSIPANIGPNQRSIVERWKETLANHYSKQLTAQQLEKTKKLQELAKSMSGFNIRRQKIDLSAPVNNNSSPYPTVKSEDLITVDAQPFTEVQEFIQSYMDMGLKMEEQFNVLSSKFPERKQYIAPEVSDVLQGINNLMPLLQKAKEKLQLAQQRLEGNRNIGGLTDDIWKRIFSFLPLSALGRVSYVCRDWYTLAQDDSLWRTKSLELHTSGVKPFCPFAADFSPQKLKKIEHLYGNWFNNSNWRREDSKELQEFSFNWPVYDLEIDDSALVTVSDCLRVFDLARNKSKAVLAGHTKVVNSVKIVKNMCVTGSVDKTVKLWSLTTNECIHTLEGHRGPITGVHQTSQFIISTCAMDKTVRFWDKTTGNCVHTMEFPNPVTSLSLNMTVANDYIYLGHNDGLVTTWDIQAQREVQKNKISSRNIESLQVFDNQFIASDYAKIYVQSSRSDELSYESQQMNRNVGKLQYDGYKLGAQIGNRLQIFDLRYLFTEYSQVTVDNLWKGAFQFHDNYVMIGGGNGTTNKWFPD